MSLLRGPGVTTCGLTLTELIITSVLGIIVVLGVTKLDVARTMMELNIHERTAAAQPNRFGAALAALKIGESLTRADRAIVTGPDGNGLYTLQVRVPECDGKDTACGNWIEQHRWEQYSVDTATTPWRLAYYASAHTPTTLLFCGKYRVMAQEITGLEFHFENEEVTPPGGEPNFSPNQPLGGGEDNNMVSYALTWSDGTTTQTFRGQAMTRAWAYTNVAEGGLLDPRFGDPSPPPALCSGPANPGPPADRQCVEWTGALANGPCVAGVPYCVTDAAGTTTCIDTNTLCTVVIGVADRERRSFCVDVPPGTSGLQFSSIYFDGPPQCGRYYHRFTPPDDSGAAPEECGGGAVEGGSGICVWNKANPPPGRWYVDIIGDTPSGTCNDNTLIMALGIS